MLSECDWVRSHNCRTLEGLEGNIPCGNRLHVARRMMIETADATVGADHSIFVFCQYNRRIIVGTKCRMSGSLPRQAESEYDEILMLLQHGLPQGLRGRWINSPDGMKAMFDSGGIDALSPGFISKALKSNQDNKKFFESNRYQNKTWYCFSGAGVVKEYTTPMDQTRIIRDKMKTVETEAEKRELDPKIPPSWCCRFELNHLKKYVTPNPKHNTTTPVHVRTNAPTQTPASSSYQTPQRIGRAPQTNSVPWRVSSNVQSRSAEQGTRSTGTSASTVTPSPNKEKCLSR